VFPVRRLAPDGLEAWTQVIELGATWAPLPPEWRGRATISSSRGTRRDGARRFYTDRDGALADERDVACDAAGSVHARFHRRRRGAFRAPDPAFPAAFVYALAAARRAPLGSDAR